MKKTLLKANKRTQRLQKQKKIKHIIAKNQTVSLIQKEKKLIVAIAKSCFRLSN